jgi:sugar phosphate isomerase/epimerase
MKILPIAFLAAGAAFGSPVSDHLGLQLWSLREDLKTDVPKGLDEAKGFGFTVVETAGTYGLSVSDFHRELAAHSLQPVAAHFQYAQLEKDLPGVIADAKMLGVTYVVVPFLPMPEFNSATAREVAARFNAWGTALQAAGLKFAFHPHGYEFRTLPEGGTPFDLLVRLTKPEVVWFEMDVFWVLHAGVNPATLLAKYPDRWRLMHVKDMRRGAPTGLNTRKAPVEDNVAIGAGRMDWPELLRVAARIGIEYYFIEDETAAPLTNIPVSAQYLRTLQY